MKQSLLVRILAVVAIALVLAAGAVADTVELKNGRVLNGKYLGGTQNNIRFQVEGGEIELIPVGDVLAITFGSSRRAPAAPAEPAEETAPPRRPEPVARPTSGSVTVPAGTAILVRMIDSVDSETNQVGDRFRASLEEDLVVDGVLVAPKGTDVYGRLSRAEEAGRLAGRSELELELTDILINNQLQPIVSGEYSVAGDSRGRDTAKKVGVGAAAGAVIGAIAGGGKGAAIGAGVGAGAGTAIQVITKGEQVRVPSETLLEFRIREAFTVRFGR